MSTPRLLGFLALAISGLSIAWGYSVSAQWWGAVTALVAVLVFGVAAARDPSRGVTVPSRAASSQAAWARPAFLQSACLVAIFGLSVAGILAGAAAFAVIFGATAALAAWDLFAANRPNGAAASATARTYERRREVSLALALAAGLLLIATGKLLALRIPFVLVVLLVLLDAFSLDRLSRYLRT